MTTPEEVLVRRPVDRDRVDELKRQMLAQTRGFRLRELRETHGMSPEYLAKAAGISAADFERIEKGDVEELTVALLRRNVDAVGGELRLEVELGDTRFRIG